MLHYDNITLGGNISHQGGNLRNEKVCGASQAAWETPVLLCHWGSEYGLWSEDYKNLYGKSGPVGVRKLCGGFEPSTPIETWSRISIKLDGNNR